MTRFDVGGESFIIKTDDCPGYETPLSNFGVRKGDRVKINSIVTEENNHGIPEYAVDVFRDGEVIETDISVSEIEIMIVCDNDRNHQVVYHDAKEKWICPFCEQQ